ncbi:hypothetical protein [Archangium violaceum]|uniref:Uncharacterized protein n=1 Tax=Archangium violaceum Cb vi76 TaxID=1406225 RepID=A0A084SX23_9BACT|nr:hypothetical protein [Archangium violaceum]KFA93008.1 hypothetical protein Q664_12060 [Archangium violaceum Cb vi76]
MTSPQEPTDALDGLERTAQELAVHGYEAGVSWDDLLVRLQAPPLQQSPSLRPGAARRSGTELQALIIALREKSSSSAPREDRSFVRAGYLIEGTPGLPEPSVRPALAEALAARQPALELRQLFPDLWAVDLELWQQLDSQAVSPRTLALLWLSSPGRRLVQDLSVLPHLPRVRTFGASDFSPSRLHSASGPFPSGTSAPSPRTPWHELHTAVPGRALAHWQPADGSVRSALRILGGQQGEPLFLRGAALAWLLDRAAEQPSYELEGLQRSLRDDLLLAFISGFPPPEDASRHARSRDSARLETACLLHAARLVEDAPSGTAAARGWSLARWLQSCTFRSPFVGGDEEALSARLRALLPASPSDIPSRDDVLDPSRFSDEGQGLDIAELALVAGAALHYRPDAPETRARLLPTPLPLVQALRRVADRTLNPGELQAEALLARFQEGSLPREPTGQGHAPLAGPVSNALGWEARHVAPPLVARWVLSHHRISWLARVSARVLEECLELFQHQPPRHDWLALAVFAEGQELGPGARARVAEVWRGVLQATGGSLGQRGELTLMAIGVLDQLSEEESEGVAALVRFAAPDWRHRDLEALAEAAEKQGRVTPWRASMEGLLSMCADKSVDTENRLRAALLALRRASSSSLPERAGYLQRLASLGARAPFIQNVALRRELRRLGLVSALESKGGR